MSPGPALLLRRLRPALEERRALGVAGGGERERPGEARLGAPHVERERALAGQGQVTDRVRLQLLRLLCVGGGADQLERGQVVVGEHVGEVLRPLACLSLEPGCGGTVAGGAGGAGDLPVADVPDQQVPEAVLAPRPASSSCGRGARAPCARARAAPARPRAGRASPISATAPAQKSLPMTDASCSRLFRSGESVSNRAAISACTESGSWTSSSVPESRSRSASRRTNSSAYRGLPPARSRSARCVSAGRTARSSSEPSSRAVSSSESGARLIVVALRVRPPRSDAARTAPGGPCRAGGAARPPPSRPGARERRAERGPPSADPRRRAPSPARRQRLEEAPPGRERLLLGGGLAGAPTSGERRARSQGRSGSSAGSGSLELGRRLLGRVRLEDAALRLHDLAERPEGDPLPVGKAAALPPADERRGDPRCSRRAPRRGGSCRRPARPRS